MLIPFDALPGHSRVWIYQANRTLSPAETTRLDEGLKNLCTNWAAHGWPLHTSYKIAHNQFVILSVDEQQAGASGCSIDSSVNALKQLQQELGVDFFDRSRIAFETPEGVKHYALTELKTLFENQILSPESLAFNNLVATKDEWEKSWRVSVSNSWLSRYLPKSTVAR